MHNAQSNQERFSNDNTNGQAPEHPKRDRMAIATLLNAAKELETHKPLPVPRTKVPQTMVPPQPQLTLLPPIVRDSSQTKLAAYPYNNEATFQTLQPPTQINRETFNFLPELVGIKTRINIVCQGLENQAENSNRFQCLEELNRLSQQLIEVCQTAKNLLQADTTDHQQLEEVTNQNPLQLFPPEQNPPSPQSVGSSSNLPAEVRNNDNVHKPNLTQCLKIVTPKSTKFGLRVLTLTPPTANTTPRNGNVLTNVNRSIPIARPSIPIARPSIPVARPSIPIARPSIPIARPSIPSVRPSIPYIPFVPSIPTVSISTTLKDGSEVTSKSLSKKKGKSISSRDKKIKKKTCPHCKSKKKTPEWRASPYGENIKICNACGLFYRKLKGRYGCANAELIMKYRRQTRCGKRRRVPKVFDVPSDFVYEENPELEDDIEDNGDEDDDDEDDDDDDDEK